MEGSKRNFRVKKNVNINPIVALKLFCSELKNGYIVVLSLYVKNYLNSYAGTALGKLWLVMMPLVPIVLYNALQVSGLFGESENRIPRSISLTYGLTLYYSFSQALVTISGLIINNRGVIVSSGVSKILLSFSEVLSVASDLVIRSIVFWLLLEAMDMEVGFRGFSILLWGGFLIVLGYSVGLVISLFAVIYKDLVNFIQIAAFYLLFASNVFSPIDGDGIVWDILRSMPLYQVIGKTRLYVFENLLYFNQIIIVIGVCCFLSLVGSLTIYYRGERYINKIL
jgi:ABC-type polysaccharide/polyol phosphate export permease